ncbi:MAG: amino acid transporter substrate-binding protein [Oscillospiraceae bacterium]|nr:amino acid transporter substrate-binding protein [Oscillospiraceae bacterium]
MKKLIASVLTGVIGLCLFVGCGSANTSSDAGSTAKKTLIVGVDDQFAPMGFRDENNNIVGFDIDLAKKVAEKMGREIKIQPINWDNKFIELESGNIDVIWNGFTITDERKGQCLFTKPYLANEQVIVVKNDDTKINKIADLAGKNVIAQKDSSALDAINKQAVAKDIKLTEIKDNVSGLLEIKNGSSDALVMDSVVAKYYITKEPNTYKIAGEALAPEEYGIGVKKGRDDFLAELQKAFNDIVADGSAKTISEKWFGEDLLLK